MAIKFGTGKKATAAVPAGKPASKASGSSGAGKGASLIPTDWTSGGLINDVDVTIMDMTFVDDWTYNGAVSDPVLALKVTFKPDEGDPVEQCFSAGDLARWMPDPNNPKHVVPAEGSSAKALNNNTNCAAFLGSIIDAGFPLNVKGHEVSEFVDVFEGLYCHVMRVPQKKRSGIQQADAKERDVLVVSNIHRLPWEAAKTGAKSTAAVAGKTNGAAKAKLAAAPVEEEETATDDALVEEAATLVATVLEEKGGSVASGQLSIALLKHLQGNDNRAAIIALVKNPEFLGMEGAPWSFDGKMLTAA
jgi:hypothetical protein